VVNSILRRYLAPLAVALAGTLASAPVLTTEVYRWVDQEGGVHFGDRPPHGRNAERIEIESPMGALPLPDAEEILRRPARPAPEPATEAIQPEATVEESDDGEPEFLRDRRGRR